MIWDVIVRDGLAVWEDFEAMAEVDGVYAGVHSFFIFSRG